MPRSVTHSNPERAAESSHANNNPHDRHDRHRGNNHSQTYHDSQPDPNPRAVVEENHYFTGVPETKRHSEQRGLVMAVLVLLGGFFVTFMAVALTAWVWWYAPVEWDDYERTAVLALSIALAALLILAILVSFAAGFLSVFWFICWSTGTRPNEQPTHLNIIFILYIVLAVIYYIGFMVGIAYFVLLLIYHEDRYYWGFWTILFAFIITLMLIGLIWFAKKTAKVRDASTIQYYDCYADAMERHYRDVEEHGHRHHHHHHHHHHGHHHSDIGNHHREHGSHAHHNTRPAPPEAQYRPEDHPEDANYGRSIVREHPY